jgi:hypothetical protein
MTKARTTLPLARAARRATRCQGSAPFRNSVQAARAFSCDPARAGASALPPHPMEDLEGPSAMFATTASRRAIATAAPVRRAVTARAVRGGWRRWSNRGRRNLVRPVDPARRPAGRHRAA